MKAAKPTNRKRPTLGLLIDWVSDYQMGIVSGTVDAAKAHDINLLCIEGGCIGTKTPQQIQRNLLYDLVTDQDVDGLIILSASIGHYTSIKKLRAFCQRYQPLPTVTIANKVEGCSSLQVNNASGIQALIHHLINIHHYHQFAVITGPPDNHDSLLRLNTIKETLATYHIQLDEDLIFIGDFSFNSGIEAITALIDDRRKPFDLLCAVSDEMALGALEALRSRGIQVPEEIGVVGFDNIVASAFSEPSLTTVNQSLYDQGAQSVECLLKMIQTGQAPTDIVLPTKLVVRDSCGCFSHVALMDAQTHDPVATWSFDSLFSTDKDAFVEFMLEKTRDYFTNKNESDFRQIIHQIVDAFYSQLLLKKENLFMKTCHKILQRFRNDSNIFSWQKFFYELRCQFLNHCQDATLIAEIEEIFLKIAVIVGEKAIEHEHLIRNELFKNNITVNSISSILLGTNHIAQLLETLESYLPQLGISSFFITKFLGNKRKPSMMHRTLLVHNSLGHINANDTDERIVPKDLWADGQSHALLIMTLNPSENPFGVMGLELNSSNTIAYGALHGIVSGALNSIVLTRRIKGQEKYLISQREHLKNLAEMKKAMEGFVRTILVTIDVRDPYTSGHQKRVSDLAQAIAKKMNLSPELVEGIRMAAVIHDLGKISIPASILVKPGKLDDIEFELIKEHPQTANKILKNIDFPWPIAIPILQHHERMDGSGYPYGLMGPEICIEARIIGVADVIEAMASHRPYRPALGLDQALAEIRQNSGTLFDPAVVDACVELFMKDGYTYPSAIHNT